MGPASTDAAQCRPMQNHESMVSDPEYQAQFRKVHPPLMEMLQSNAVSKLLEEMQRTASEDYSRPPPQASFGSESQFGPSRSSHSTPYRYDPVRCCPSNRPTGIMLFLSRSATNVFPPRVGISLNLILLQLRLRIGMRITIATFKAIVPHQGEGEGAKDPLRCPTRRRLVHTTPRGIASRETGALFCIDRWVWPTCAHRTYNVILLVCHQFCGLLLQRRFTQSWPAESLSRMESQLRRVPWVHRATEFAECFRLLFTADGNQQQAVDMVQQSAPRPLGAKDAWLSQGSPFHLYRFACGWREAVVLQR